VTWVDVLIIVVVLLSALVSLWRGFVRELISLVTWVAAFGIAMIYAQRIDGVFAGLIGAPSIRVVVAFFLLFLATLLAGALVNNIAGQAVKRSGLGGMDRGLGVLFGGFRGVVIVAVLVLLAGLTTLPADPWWQASMLLPWFEAVATMMMDFLPADTAEHFQF